MGVIDQDILWPKAGLGKQFIITGPMNCEYRWRAAKISFVLKFCLCL